MYEAERNVCRREWRLPVRGILLAAVLFIAAAWAIPARADTAYGYIAEQRLGVSDLRGDFPDAGSGSMLCEK